MKTAVIITTFNRRALLKETIYSLKESFAKEKADIFVFDDGSTDGTSDFLKTMEDITYFRSSGNVGLRATLNQALSHLKRLDYDFISYNQDDVIFRKGWLDEFIEMWNSYEGKRPIGFITGHDAPEHPTLLETKIEQLGFHVKVKDTCRATHLFASSERWYKFGPIPDLTPGIAAPKPGYGSKVDWWLVGHLEGKYPQSQYSLKKMGEKILVLPGRVIHIGWNKSTWGIQNPEYSVTE